MCTSVEQKCLVAHVLFSHGYRRWHWTEEQLLKWELQSSNFMKQFARVFSDKSLMTFPKAHDIIHVASFVRRFGSPLNWRAMDFESVHQIAKHESNNWNHQQPAEKMLLVRVYIINLILLN